MSGDAMKALYEVTATRGEIVVSKSYQVAASEQQAIEFAKYYIAEKYTEIRAVFIRSES